MEIAKIKKGDNMGFNIVIPESAKGNFYKKKKLLGIHFAIGINAHSLQCGQIWKFLFRIGKRRFGYRTKGDATKDLLTYYDSGFHFPWQNRNVSGRG
jgi:hypothetical protein